MVARRQKARAPDLHGTLQIIFNLQAAAASDIIGGVISQPS